jgi:hypothetical protein
MQGPKEEATGPDTRAGMQTAPDVEIDDGAIQVGQRRQRQQLLGKPKAGQARDTGVAGVIRSQASSREGKPGRQKRRLAKQTVDEASQAGVSKHATFCRQAALETESEPAQLAATSTAK